MILECGKAIPRRGNEEDLLMQLILCLRKCQVEMIIVDEIQHIVLPELRRRAIQHNLSRLSPAVLEETWRDIQTRQVTDFLQVLRLGER